MKKIIFILFVLSSFLGSSQTIYITTFQSQADLKVCIVEYESQADLLVYKSPCAAYTAYNDGNWFFTDYSSRADKQIMLTNFKSLADLTICFVKYKTSAKWKNKSKKYLLK